MIASTPHPAGVVIAVRAQPGARKNAVMGVHAGALRVAVSAAPERGKANEAILEVLAEALGCRPSHLELVSGAGSRAKRVLLKGFTVESLRERLTAVLGPSRTLEPAADPESSPIAGSRNEPKARIRRPG